MHLLKTIFKAFSAFWKTEVWELSGLEPQSKTTCTVIYAGHEVHKNYIANLIYNGAHAETLLGTYNFWALRRLINRTKVQYDLVFIEGQNLQQWWYQSANDFFIPLWLGAKAAIPLKVTNRSTKDDTRRIRKYNLDYRLAHTVAEYDHFYHNMYLPSMAQRHEDRAIIMAYDKMMTEITLNGAQLLLVTLDEQTIAGTIILRHGSTPTLWSTGILNADPDYWKTGVASASYVFCAQYLAEQGYKEMDMGLSRAFLSDGVLQYKKKWNARFTAVGRSGFILKVNSLTPASKGFLQRHPFVHRTQDAIYGVVCFESDSETEETLAKKRSRYDLSGFNACRFFKFEMDGNRLENVNF
jgi:hypothetical protein